MGTCGLDPGWGRSPGGGHGNPLQYSCLRNPMDREAWWATAHRVAKSQTLPKELSIVKVCFFIGSIAMSNIFSNHLKEKF